MCGIIIFDEDVRSVFIMYFRGDAVKCCVGNLLYGSLVIGGELCEAAVGICVRNSAH
jgi:hypothetical protein